MVGGDDTPTPVNKNINFLRIFNFNSMTDFNKISIKDIINLLGVSFSAAQRIYSDVKKEYSLKIVTYYHFKKYLKIE